MSDIADFVQSVKSSRHKLGQSAEKLADLMSSRPLTEPALFMNTSTASAKTPRWQTSPEVAHGRTGRSVLLDHTILRCVCIGLLIAPRACPSTLLRTVSLSNPPVWRLTGFVTNHPEQCGLESREWNATVSDRPPMIIGQRMRRIRHTDRRNLRTPQG